MISASSSHLPILSILFVLAAPAHATGAEDASPVSAAFGGRLHLDFAQFDDDHRGAPNEDGVEIRRLWLDATGRAFVADYKVEIDLAGLQEHSGIEQIDFKDVYLKRDFSGGRLTVGQFKQYFALDDRISSDGGVFMERGMFAQNLAPTYRLGAAWLTSRDRWTIGGSVYSLESLDAWKIKGDALGARGTWTPLNSDGRVVHLGLSAASEWYDHPGADGAAPLRIRPRPAGHLSDNSRATLVSFGAGRDTDVDKGSLEFGASFGAWYAQAECGVARFDDGVQRGDIDSAYGLIGWTITGETTPYDARNGRFGSLKPSGTHGAWQVGLRYDTIRGRQHGVGKADFRVSMDAATVGVNWYVRPDMRLMLDWTQSHNLDRLADATLDRTRAVTGRFQYSF